MHTKLDHVAIRVKDMDRAIEYYLSLGLNLEWESKDWSYFEEGIALLGPGYNRAEPHFALFLDNHDELKKKFARVIGASTDTSSFTAESVSAPVMSEVDQDEPPFDGGEPISTDDTMSYFSKLAEA